MEHLQVIKGLLQVLLLAADRNRAVALSRSRKLHWRLGYRLRRVEHDHTSVSR